MDELRIADEVEIASSTNKVQDFTMPEGTGTCSLKNVAQFRLKLK
jgi:hypothetical protein